MPYTTQDELKELFPDLKFKHPDCWFRLKREGNLFRFMISLNDQLWETITISAVPDTDYFDIRLPVTLPQDEAEEGDEDDII